MKAVVICPECGDKGVRLVSDLGKDDVYVVCSECGKMLGRFSVYALKEEKNDDAE